MNAVGIVWINYSSMFWLQSRRSGRAWRWEADEFWVCSSSSCPQTSFHQCHCCRCRHSPGAPKLFQIFLLTREGSSRVSSFPSSKNRYAREPFDAGGGYFQRPWLFFLAFLFPSDNICVDSRQFYYKLTQLEGWRRGKNGRPLGESCVLAAVDSHKKQDFCLKSLLLGSRQQQQQDTQTHLGYCRNLVADVLFLMITGECIWLVWISWWQSVVACYAELSFFLLMPCWRACMWLL